MEKAYRRGLALALGILCLGLVPAIAVAADPYELDPPLSLTGDCSTLPPDPIADPGCPTNPPEGPHPPSGRFDDPRSVAVDSYGNLYVASFAGDGEEGRIDVFDAKGRFITELLDPNGPISVAVDSMGNLYVFEHLFEGASYIVRYSPTVYDPEAGKIEYGKPGVVIGTNQGALGGVAIDASNDHLFVSFASNFIREYSSAEDENKLLNTITNEKFSWTSWLAVDAERRRLYASYCEEGHLDCAVLVLDADSYELLKVLDGSNTPAGKFQSSKGWTSIAVDEQTGDFFVEDLEVTNRVYQFNADYEYVATIQHNSLQGGNALQIAVSNGETASGDAFNRHRLFVPVLNAAGRVLAFKPPSTFAPVVKSATATNIAERGAELQALIDPRGGETEYVFEYVTQAEFEVSGFANASVAGQGTIPKESQPTQALALLEGLTPGTAYRFRVIATNVKGEDEGEGAFATYSDAPVSGSSCPNLSLRMGLSSSLPDCRAYELVTPADTNGRPPRGLSAAGDSFATLGASPAGSAVSWLAQGGVVPGADGTGGFSGDPYRSTRTASGWTTIGTGPSGVETDTLSAGSSSPDQGFLFWTANGSGSAVINGSSTHYVRYPDGRSELIGRGSIGTDPAAVGRLITEGGTHIVFQTDFANPDQERLEPNSPPVGTNAVYDRTLDEVTHLVSLLPGEVTPAADEHATYLGASEDGEGIAFSIGKTIYLRVGNAVTYEVAEEAVFAGVADGGNRVFYVKDGDLLAFDVETKGAIAFAEPGDAIAVNVAPDGSRAYFVSTTVIPGSGENPSGAAAKPGAQNLYLSEEGEVSFVATVTLRDVEGKINKGGGREDGLGLWAQVLASGPGATPSRLTPDGSVLIFQSRANLVGYDPGDFPQIYRYDSVAGRLHCISCLPTGAAANGGASLQSLSSGILDKAPLRTIGFVPNITPDGKRVFFESKEALVARDSDGVQDVYEWEEGGVGSCDRPGGCVYLISSGQSVRDNYLYGHSRSGDDVFFTTEDVLVPGDNDALSIYDAKVGGGFPLSPEDECTGEACRPGLAPAPDLAPPAPAPAPEGDVPPKKRVCPKGKRKVKRHGKVRCVKKKKRQGRRAAR